MLQNTVDGQDMGVWILLKIKQNTEIILKSAQLSDKTDLHSTGFVGNTQGWE